MAIRILPIALLGLVLLMPANAPRAVDKVLRVEPHAGNLRKIGANVEVAVNDWGTMAARRAKQELALSCWHADAV